MKTNLPLETKRNPESVFQRCFPEVANFVIYEPSEIDFCRNGHACSGCWYCCGAILAHKTYFIKRFVLMYCQELNQSHHPRKHILELSALKVILLHRPAYAFSLDAFRKNVWAQPQKLFQCGRSCFARRQQPR